MPYLSLVDAPSDGLQLVFQIPFPYINKDYVKAYSIAPDGNGLFNTTPEPLSFTWNDPSSIRLNAPVASGSLVRIQRQTPRDAPLVDFTNAAMLVESELDLQTLQILHILQEVAETKSADNTTELYEKIQEYVEDIAAMKVEVEDVIVRIQDLVVVVEGEFDDMLDEANAAIATANAAAAAANASKDTAASLATLARQYADAAAAASGNDMSAYVQRTELQAAVNGLLASPTFTGTPRASATIPVADNSTRLATTAHVKAQGYAPAASPTFTGTVSVGVGSILSIPGRLTITGTADLGDKTQATTPASDDNSKSVATTAFVKAQGYAPRNTPSFSGTLTVNGSTALLGATSVNTAATADKSTTIANTEFVRNAITEYAATSVNYSTDEKDTGLKWIDGKKIWRKTVVTGALPNASWKTVAHGVANVDMILFIDGIANSPLQPDYALYLMPVGNTALMGAGKTNIGLYSSTNLSNYTQSWTTIYYTCTDR